MSKRLKIGILLAAGIAGVPMSRAAAGEILSGVAAHDVNVGIATDTREGGVDAQLGYRTGPVAALARFGAPDAYGYISLNSRHRTNFAAAGLSWRLWLGSESKLYVKPGIGVAVHDGYVDLPPEEPGLANAEIIRRAEIYRTRKPYGSRFMFEPSVAIGWRAADRVSLEAFYAHLSHAKLGGNDNPGVDLLGLRLAYRLKD